MKFRDQSGFRLALLNRKLSCVTVGAFYPNKPHLISEAYIARTKKRIVSNRYFISSVSIDHLHPFAAETCGVLAFMITMDCVLTKFPSPFVKFHLKMGLDYQIVIENMWNKSLIITWNKHIHQLLKDTKLIQNRWNIQLCP